MNYSSFKLNAISFGFFPSASKQELMGVFGLHVLFSQFRLRDVLKRIRLLSFLNCTCIYTWIGQNLKETVFWGNTSHGLKLNGETKSTS